MTKGTLFFRARREYFAIFFFFPFGDFLFLRMKDSPPVFFSNRKKEELLIAFLGWFPRVNWWEASSRFVGEKFLLPFSPRGRRISPSQLLSPARLRLLPPSRQGSDLCPPGVRIFSGEHFPPSPKRVKVILASSLFYFALISSRLRFFFFLVRRDGRSS